MLLAITNVYPLSLHDALPILAFGKHGGEELNYSSDIDLMFVYAEEGQTRGKRITSAGNDEFFGRVVTEVEELVVAGAGDRKSTRLNSSHVEISYAVFCLKKKK